MQNINGIDFLTTQEAAEYKGLSVKTIQKWIRQKEKPLQAIKIGDNKRTQYLIQKEILDAYSPKPVGRPKP